ncbi:hypothetical protein KIPB_010917, partial [Kipferlia bialata]|eukprot:g10917.t1
MSQERVECHDSGSTLTEYSLGPEDDTV